MFLLYKYLKYAVKNVCSTVLQRCIPIWLSKLSAQQFDKNNCTCLLLYSNVSRSALQHLLFIQSLSDVCTFYVTLLSREILCYHLCFVKSVQPFYQTCRHGHRKACSFLPPFNCPSNHKNTMCLSVI